jgi:sn-glycerol 3-phosphate transport system permease protein
MPRVDRRTALIVLGLMLAVVFLWSTPFLWTLVASFRPESAGGIEMASLLPDYRPTWENFEAALESGNFARYYLNTAIVAFGILAVQLVTISLAGYAFARLSFPGRDVIFYVFLLQLMLVPPILIVPNLSTVVDLGLYGSLLGVMLPYFASAFGTFLMRQTFRQIPRDFEEAAIIDGAHWWQTLWHVLLPMAKPGLIAFSLVSLMAHWNEFLWPLMVLNEPRTQTLTIGLAAFAVGSEGGKDWGLLAAGTLLVMFPLLALFAVFQRQFVNSFMFSGLKG